jgi:hypothetical protein
MHYKTPWFKFKQQHAAPSPAKTELKFVPVLPPWDNGNPHPPSSGISHENVPWRFTILLIIIVL